MVIVAGFNTRANLLFFTGYLLTGIFILSFIFSIRNISNLRVSRKIEKVTFQNEIVRVDLELYSDSPASFVKVRDQFTPASGDERIKDLFIYNLDKSRVRLSYEEKAVMRGRFKIGPVEAESDFPFLLFTRRRVLEEYSEILVYPEVTDMKGFPAYEQIITASVNKIITTIGGSNEFFGIRDYQTGDSMRSIDWKVSARMNQLVVKEFEKQLGYSTYLLFDVKREENSRERFNICFEKSVNIAASVLKNRIDNNDNVGFIWGDRYILPASGKEQLFQILNELALVNMVETDILEKSYINAVNIAEPENILIIISRNINARYLEFIKLLIAKKIRVIFIYLVPESFSGKLDKDPLSPEIHLRFKEILLTGATLYPYYKDDLISEIFNKGN